ncbi:MAG: hypothetical protein ACOYKE_04155 [Ferruginibacter sp.]
MIKIIIRNPEKYKQLLNSWLRKYIFFDFKNLQEIKDEVLFYKAITQLKMQNGIYKKTNAKRFEDVDATLIQHLKKDTVYQLHDVAVSDGITSVDLYNNLKQAGIQVSFTISDKFAKVLSEKKWYGQLYKDADGFVLYADFLGIQAYRRTSVAYIISKFLGYFIPTKSAVTGKEKELYMLNPKTMEAIHNKTISFQYFDIFEPAANTPQYDIVRCMNVLNYKVFPDDDIVSAIKNLLTTVKENGFFVFGRTEDITSVNNASILQKLNGKVVLVADINQGSELKFLLKDIIH